MRRAGMFHAPEPAHCISCLPLMRGMRQEALVKLPIGSAFGVARIVARFAAFQNRFVFFEKKLGKFEMLEQVATRLKGVGSRVTVLNTDSLAQFWLLQHIVL